MIFSTASGPVQTMSAPASWASPNFSPPTIASTRSVWPVPWGRLTVPRTIWSAWRGSTPSSIAISTVSSNLAYATSFSFPKASSMRYGRLSTRWIALS